MVKVKVTHSNITLVKVWKYLIFHVFFHINKYLLPSLLDKSLCVSQYTSLWWHFRTGSSVAMRFLTKIGFPEPKTEKLQILGRWANTCKPLHWRKQKKKRKKREILQCVGSVNGRPRPSWLRHVSSSLLCLFGGKIQLDKTGLFLQSSHFLFYGFIPSLDYNWTYLSLHMHKEREPRLYQVILIVAV